MWNGSSKTTILLNFGTLSLGGCWGHPMRPKLNLKNKGQISKPNEYTDNFKSNCIFLSVRAKLKKNTLSSDIVYVIGYGHCNSIHIWGNWHEMHHYRLSKFNSILLQCHTGLGFSNFLLRSSPSFKPMSFFDSILILDTFIFAYFFSVSYRLKRKVDCWLN